MKFGKLFWVFQDPVAGNPAEKLAQWGLSDDVRHARPTCWILKGGRVREAES